MLLLVLFHDVNLLMIVSVVVRQLFKGFDVAPGGGILLISQVIRDALHIPCAILMGANIANEVAQEYYCEATIGR